jgi:hypothetical protein
MVSLPFGLTLKHSLCSHHTYHNLVSEISSVLKEIHAIEDLKSDPELLLLVCNLIENTLTSNKWKIDKKELAVSIHDNLFSTTDEEKTAVRLQIQFFYDNGKIKKKKWYKLVLVYSMEWIKRKFL